MSGKETRICFGVSWSVVGASLLRVGFVVLRMVMVIFFGECTFPHLVEIRENPEIHDLMREDKAHWPRCLLWHGWLPVLSGVNGASPWAVDAFESALYMVEVALGRHSSGLVTDWSLPNGLDADEVAVGCLTPLKSGLMVVVLFWIPSLVSEHCWSSRRWGRVDHVQLVRVVQSSRLFVSVPGPLQTVQRAELSGVMLALQSSDAVRVGVDNLGVVRHVGRLLNGHRCSTPFKLVTDGNLFVLVDRMLRFRCHDKVRVTEVKDMPMMVMFLMVGFLSLISSVMMLLTSLLTLVVGGLDLLSLMLVVIFLVFVVGGILLFLIFIGSSLPFPGLLLTMTE